MVAANVRLHVSPQVRLHAALLISSAKNASNNGIIKVTVTPILIAAFNNLSAAIFFVQIYHFPFKILILGRKILHGSSV